MAMHPLYDNIWVKMHEAISSDLSHGGTYISDKYIRL
jgi:hypothetical protein